MVEKKYAVKIQGTVTDERGYFVSNSKVYLLKRNEIGKRLSYGVVQVGYSNERGMYEFWVDKDNGRYRVVAYKEEDGRKPQMYKKLNTKEMLEIARRYMPREANVIQMGPYGVVDAIKCSDINGNGKGEIVLIYSINSTYYLMILEEQELEWAAVFDEELDYKKITYFNIEKIKNEEYSQIMIGGCRKRSKDMVTRLDMFDYRDGHIYSILEKSIVFDKLDVEKVNNKVQIISWINEELEAYAIGIYRWEDGCLKEGGWEEINYFKNVEKYYNYLIQLYPEEKVYKSCLEQTQDKIEEAYEKRKNLYSSLMKDSGNIELVDIYYDDNNQSYLYIFSDKVHEVHREWAERFILVSQKNEKQQIVCYKNKIRYEIYIEKFNNKYEEGFILKYQNYKEDHWIYELYIEKNNEIVKVLDTKELVLQGTYPQVKTYWNDDRKVYEIALIYNENLIEDKVVHITALKVEKKDIVEVKKFQLKEIE